MDKEKLNTLLDSIYELEGLVHLCLNRDEIPARLPELISLKGKEIADEASSLSGETAAPATTSVGESICEEPLYSVEDEDDATAEDDAVAVAAFEQLIENIPPQELQVPEPEESVSEETESPAARMDEPEAPAPVDKPVDSASPADEQAAPAEDEDEGPEEGPRLAVHSEPRGRLVFSINDRYRFRRELFADSDADFNTTLALVASMENYDEAEDYFLNELSLDGKRQEVVDFLEILKKYFKE